MPEINEIFSCGEDQVFITASSETVKQIFRHDIPGLILAGEYNHLTVYGSQEAVYRASSVSRNADFPGNYTLSFSGCCHMAFAYAHFSELIRSAAAQNKITIFFDERFLPAIFLKHFYSENPAITIMVWRPAVIKTLEQKKLKTYVHEVHQITEAAMLFAFSCLENGISARELAAEIVHYAGLQNVKPLTGYPLVYFQNLHPSEDGTVTELCPVMPYDASLMRILPGTLISIILTFVSGEQVCGMGRTVFFGTSVPDFVKKTYMYCLSDYQHLLLGEDIHFTGVQDVERDTAVYSVPDNRGVYRLEQLQKWIDSLRGKSFVSADAVYTTGDKLFFHFSNSCSIHKTLSKLESIISISDDLMQFG